VTDLSRLAGALCIAETLASLACREYHVHVNIAKSLSILYASNSLDARMGSLDDPGRMSLSLTAKYRYDRLSLSHLSSGQIHAVASWLLASQASLTRLHAARLCCLSLPMTLAGNGNERVSRARECQDKWAGWHGQFGGAWSAACTALCGLWSSIKVR
jgi:hypothetical protein